jgi:PAS domain S-box-containing protein
MLGRLDRFFLARYSAAPLEIQRKAAILWKVNLIMAAACLIAGVLINVVVFLIPFTAAVEVSTAAFLLLALAWLRRGEYRHASTLSIFAPLAGLTLTGLRGYSGEPPVDFVLLGYNNIILIFYACLIGYRRLQPLLATVFCFAALAVGFVSLFGHGTYAAYAGRYPLLINSVLLVAVSGAVAHYVMGIHEDIVRIAEEEARRHREMAEELRQAEERLLVTLRSIGDGVITTGIDGRIVLMNRIAGELTGWPPAEAEGRPLREVLRIIDDASRAPCPCLVEKVLATGTVTTCGERTLLVARNGTERAVADSAAPIRDRDSRVVGVVLVLHDVTEKLRMEEQLRNAQKLESLGILAGGIAHDFNNLLAGIFGYVELAHEATRGAAPAAAEHLERALAVFGRATSLTHQLLTFSRGGLPVKKPVSLAPLIRENTLFVLGGSNVLPRFDVADDLWPCEADSAQLAQVVDNLVFNARQAMPSGGTLTVAAHNVPRGAPLPPGLPPGDYLRIEVADEGIGIPRRHIGIIFDPFFTTKQQGSGLGLTIVHSIVRKHEGAIEVSSEPGKGSTFTIHLPAAPGAVAPERAAGAQDENARIHARVLVVDDEDVVRQLARMRLEAMGCQVTCAADGEQGLEAAREAVAAGAPFDVAILDLTIPGGAGGVEITAALRLIDPRIRTIASSGYSNDPVMADPARHGFDGRLAKPYRGAELRDALREALRDLAEA